MMKKILLLSDTHSFLDPRILAYAKKADEVWHAGDIGNLEVTDQRIRAVFNEIGLKEFLKDQPNGLDTYLKPEGKQIAYTVAKKIILARAIIKNPKLLILEDPLDQFSMEEAANIITYITDPIHNWSLIVVSANKQWESSCNTIVNLDNGKIQ